MFRFDTGELSRSNLPQKDEPGVHVLQGIMYEKTGYLDQYAQCYGKKGRMCGRGFQDGLRIGVCSNFRSQKFNCGNLTHHTCALEPVGGIIRSAFLRIDIHTNDLFSPKSIET